MYDINDDIINGCINNDPISQNKLYNLTHRKIRQSLKNRFYFDDISDFDLIISDTYIRVFKYISKFKNDTSILNWIGKISYNLALNNERYKEKPSISKTKYIINDEYFKQLPVKPEQYDTLDYKQKLQYLKNNLSDREYCIFILYLGGYKHNDISKIMGFSEATSKWWVHETKNKIKKMPIFN